MPNATSFPDGIDGLANKLHAMNLKLGIYSSAGSETCAGYPASIGKEEIDAETWAAWGIDCKSTRMALLKYCSNKAW